MNDQDKPVTKQDLIEVLEGLEARMDQKLIALEERLSRAFQEDATSHNQRASNPGSFQDCHQPAEGSRRI